MPNSLPQRDERCLWHPFTQHATEPERLAVARARGASLFLEDGTELLDAISSWWCNLHGHGRTELVEAMQTQAQTLDHVLFAGATHKPAVELAEWLIERTPASLERVFFSDNGSTAVEVALKMAFQSWLHRGESQRTRFVSFYGSYHGDTIGAMSVGDPDPFFVPFQPLLFRVKQCSPDSGALQSILAAEHREIAAVILEPMVQGAGGMRMQPPEFVRAVRELSDRYGIPLIADEVMTGFGRTGKWFACDHAEITPDFLCLAKGLTGGTMPLAVTLTTNSVFEQFLASERRHAFFHGHTFTANPIGCAVALASMKLAENEATPEKLERIGRTIWQELVPFVNENPRVAELRRLGGIVAFDILTEPDQSGYLSDVAGHVRRRSIEQGVLLRPLGNVVYAMPPSCTTETECQKIAAVMKRVAETL